MHTNAAARSLVSRTLGPAALLGLVLAVQLWTLPWSPTVWQDEAQIIDIGREWFEPTSPATIWFEPGRAGLPQLSYVGGVLMEVVYRLGGGTYLAPRLLSLGAGALAALACLVWLRRLGIESTVATVAALWLYLDPVIERSYRGGRVDVLAIAVAFGACAVIAGGHSRMSLPWRLVLTGALGALLPWIWLPGFLLWPLIGVAVWHKGRSSDSMVGWPAAAAWIAGGAVTATLLVVWPVRDELFAVVSTMSRLLAFDATAPSAAAPQSIGVLPEVWTSMRYAPWLPVAAVAGAWLGRGPARQVGAAAALVAAVVVATRPYLYRYVYVVPYLVVLAAFALARLRASGHASLIRAAHASVVVTLLWSAGLALGYRTWVAWDERPGRDHTALETQLEQALGRGGRSVYVEALETYHAGRALGWRMYRATHASGTDDRDEALRLCDAVIIHSVFDSPARRALFMEAGFDSGTLVNVPAGGAPRAVRYGGAAYGPFVVFRRVAD